jgi:hypothetical protein
VCRLSEEAHRLLVRSLCNVLLLSWPGLQEQKWEDRKKHLGQENHNFTAYYQCFGSGVVYTGFRIRVFLSRIQSQKDTALRFLSILTNTFFLFTLGNMIRDVHPCSGFFSIPDLGVQKAP